MPEVSKPHSELFAVVREGLQSPEEEDYMAALVALIDLEEQLEALRETIRHADHFIRQPIDLNYVAIPKDDWETILNRVSSPAISPDDQAIAEQVRERDANDTGERLTVEELEADVFTANSPLDTPDDPMWQPGGVSNQDTEQR